MGRWVCDIAPRPRQTHGVSHHVSSLPVDFDIWTTLAELHIARPDSLDICFRKESPLRMLKDVRIFLADDSAVFSQARLRLSLSDGRRSGLPHNGVLIQSRCLRHTGNNIRDKLRQRSCGVVFSAILDLLDGLADTLWINDRLRWLNSSRGSPLRLLAVLMHRGIRHHAKLGQFLVLLLGYVKALTINQKGADAAVVVHRGRLGGWRRLNGFWSSLSHRNGLGRLRIVLRSYQTSVTGVLVINSGLLKFTFPHRLCTGRNGLHLKFTRRRLTLAIRRIVVGLDMECIRRIELGISHQPPSI
jgi:hypothetical protein